MNLESIYRAPLFPKLNQANVAEGAQPDDRCQLSHFLCAEGRTIHKDNRTTCLEETRQHSSAGQYHPYSEAWWGTRQDGGKDEDSNVE